MGVGAVRLRPIQPVCVCVCGGGGGGGGGGGVAVRFRPIQPVGGSDVCFRPIQSMRCPPFHQIQPVGGGCCPLSVNSASGGVHMCM